MSHVWIYGLRENGSDEIRYVGHTKDIQQRLYQHKTKTGQIKGNAALSAWLDETGDNLLCETIDYVPANQARKHEEKHMRKLAGKGHRLLNIRQAARKIYTSEQAHQILSEHLKDVIT